YVAQGNWSSRRYGQRPGLTIGSQAISRDCASSYRSGNEPSLSHRNNLDISAVGTAGVNRAKGYYPRGYESAGLAASYNKHGTACRSRCTAGGNCPSTNRANGQKHYRAAGTAGGGRRGSDRTRANIGNRSRIRSVGGTSH